MRMYIFTGIMISLFGSILIFLIGYMIQIRKEVNFLMWMAMLIAVLSICTLMGFLIIDTYLFSLHI